MRPVRISSRSSWVVMAATVAGVEVGMMVVVVMLSAMAAVAAMVRSD